jgi:cystathionine beta-lyase
MSSKEAIRHFAKYGIGLNPGNDFGENGEGYVRMNFACTPDTINAALVRLQQSV